MNGRPIRDPFFRPARVQGADQLASAAGRSFPKTPAARAPVHPPRGPVLLADVTAQTIGWLTRRISPVTGMLVIALEVAMLLIKALA